MLPVLFGALGLALAGASSEKRSRRDEGEAEGMGAVTLWMGGRGPAAGTGAASWMGSRVPDDPYVWEEPSSVVANWNQGTVYGVESGTGDYDIDRARKFLRWAATRIGAERAVLNPSDPVQSVLGSKGAYVVRISGTQPLSPSHQQVLSSVQGHLDQNSPGVYKVSVGQRVGGHGGLEPHITLRVEPGEMASAFGVDDLEDHDEAFGINILGLNIPLTAAERVEGLDRKIDKAKEKKASYEKDAEKEGADLDFLSKKIARLDQMIEKWEAKKEKIEMRMGAMYGGLFGTRWFKDPAAQAQADVIVKWVKHVQKIPGVKRALKMRQKGYTDEQIHKGLDPYSMGQIQSGMNGLLSALQPLVTLMVNGKVTSAEVGKFHLWLNKHYPDVEVSFPSSVASSAADTSVADAGGSAGYYGHVSAIMPNLTTAFGGSGAPGAVQTTARRRGRHAGSKVFKAEHQERMERGAPPVVPAGAKALTGAFWEDAQGSVKGRADSIRGAPMQAVPLFGGLHFDDADEGIEDIDLFGGDDFDDEFDLG